METIMKQGDIVSLRTYSSLRNTYERTCIVLNVEDKPKEYPDQEWFLNSDWGNDTPSVIAWYSKHCFQDDNKIYTIGTRLKGTSTNIKIKVLSYQIELYEKTLNKTNSTDV